MKLGNKYLWVTIGVLLIGNIIFFFLLRKNPAERSFESFKLSANVKDYVVEEMLLHMKFDHKTLKDISVVKSNYTDVLFDESYSQNDTYGLSELLQGNKVVFVFAQYACGSCVYDQLNSLEKLGSKIGYDNILVLSDKDSNNAALHMRSKNYKLNLYEGCMDHTSLFDHQPVSSLLLYTSGDQIVTSFIVGLETKEYAKHFYHFIEEEYKNK